ncbi:MAG: hypothetical protein JXM79_12675 [Sedimentisphaerales bacterium]|nr:hypothetical protein [Sedimentisphaerales bacterium]
MNTKGCVVLFDVRLDDGPVFEVIGVGVPRIGTAFVDTGPPRFGDDINVTVAGGMKKLKPLSVSLNVKTWSNIRNSAPSTS